MRLLLFPVSVARGWGAFLQGIVTHKSAACQWKRRAPRGKEKCSDAPDFSTNAQRRRKRGRRRGAVRGAGGECRGRRARPALPRAKNRRTPI